MQSIFGFSGRSGRGQYGVLTLGFSAIVFALATPSGAPFTQLMTAPWEVIASFLDDMIQIGGSRDWLDLLASVAVDFPMIGVFSVMTARRLRNMGQSPWWTVVVMFSSVVVPAMMVLSIAPSASRTIRQRMSSVKAVTVTAD